MNTFSMVRARLAAWTGLTLAALFAAGCASTDKPASATFAGVIISNHTAQQIRDATETVFRQNGYQSFGQQGGALVFQRAATRRETVDYAGIAGAHEGEKVIMQVRVRIEVKDASSYWLTCKAYAVRNPGQGVFETSTPLFDFQNDAYQKLLDKVKGTVERPAMTP